MAATLRGVAAASVSAAGGSAGFVPRTVFEVSPSITRSYFLGHHAGALTSMRRVLSNIGLILECRDSRVPLSSANPLLESSLAGRDRIIVYTKADLSAPASANRWMEKQRRLLSEWRSPPPSSSLSSSPTLLRHGGTTVAREDEDDGYYRGGGGGGEEGAGRTEVIFTDERNPRSVARLLEAIKARARASDSLVGLRALVVGMPNAGKSTLLNALRREGMQLPKAARTGSQPGVTRRLSTPVRVLAADDDTSSSPWSGGGGGGGWGGGGEGVFVMDTPGVFVPYVSDVEAMLKLSLVGCVKDGLVPAETVADYLLFRLNLRDPALYARLSPPTNDVRAFLEAVARRTGKLLRGGAPATDHAADWVVQQWRRGSLGRFALDDVSEDGLLRARAAAAAAEEAGGAGAGERLSMSQARKRQKAARKVRGVAKRQAAAEGT